MYVCIKRNSGICADHCFVNYRWITITITSARVFLRSISLISLVQRILICNNVSVLTVLLTDSLNKIIRYFPIIDVR
jgi:hypothetical protein